MCKKFWKFVLLTKKLESFWETTRSKTKTHLEKKKKKKNTFNSKKKKKKKMKKKGISIAPNYY